MPDRPTQAMDGARWSVDVEGPVYETAGQLLGWVTRLARSTWRATVMIPGSGAFPDYPNADHPDEPSARAWVEEQVRMQGEGRTR